MKRILFAPALKGALKYLLFLPLGLGQISFSQSFTPTVIGSAGTFATSASGSMSWTIGEVMTETYSSANNFFTQGFHQPDTSFVISVIDNTQPNISVYPNPVIDNVVIDFSASSGNYSVEIVDMQGQKLYQSSIISHQSSVLHISFLEFANGIYLLNIINKETNTGSSYKINKAE